MIILKIPTKKYLKISLTKNCITISEVNAGRFPGWLFGRVPLKTFENTSLENIMENFRELCKLFQRAIAWEIFGRILGEIHRGISMKESFEECTEISVDVA